jgi:pantoate--beta-alanine ligase
MKTVRTVAELRAALALARRERSSIETDRVTGRYSVGLVPTMGAFHEGHLSLIRRARQECDTVVVSVFVNPSQFGRGEDFVSYPRFPGEDAALAGREGVDLLFSPSLREVYPPGHSSTVEVAGIGETLCGAPDRRGAEHFRGVATVVAKLLNMCQPDVAFFGAKDYQQTVVIQRLVEDLNIPVRIEVCPTVRDRDGLALSSRNAYLSELDRRRAPSLKRALDAAEQAIRAGAAAASEVIEAACRELEQAGIEPEYVEVVSARDLRPLESIGGEPVLVALAARLGDARLIDNVVVEPEQVTAPTALGASR